MAFFTAAARDCVVGSSIIIYVLRRGCIVADSTPRRGSSGGHVDCGELFLEGAEPQQICHLFIRVDVKHRDEDFLEPSTAPKHLFILLLLALLLLLC